MEEVMLKSDGREGGKRGLLERGGGDRGKRWMLKSGGREGEKRWMLKSGGGQRGGRECCSVVEKKGGGSGR